MITILQGDVIEQLRTLPNESVHCCVTSPPYWGLRDYGTAQWEGGEDGCDHKMPATGGNPSQGANKGNNNFEAMPFKSECGKCGAKRIDDQLGLEKTPEQYVAKMVEVFREVRRVLRKDGTLWMNLGDSYAHGVPGAGSFFDNGRTDGRKSYEADKARGREKVSTLSKGLKLKDLCGIPWRVAFALQADGWWLRSDIIWAKPNPMPESVTDRPTKAHEYLFLLTKSANYFYDAEAIREPQDTVNPLHSAYRACVLSGKGSPQNRGAKKPELLNHSLDTGKPWVENKILNLAGRNKRSVWTVATAPYPEAHFATYPPALIKPCILAGTSAKGCCAKCGSPWERQVESHLEHINFTKPREHSSYIATGTGQVANRITKTLYWQPTCDCQFDQPLGSDSFTPPCTVLDPFAGSGTTGAVALELGRKAVLIELNPKYVELIERRCSVTMGLPLAV